MAPGFACDEMEVVSILHIELVEIVLSIVNITVMGAKSIRENGITIHHSSEKRVSSLANKPFPLGLDCYYHKITAKTLLFRTSMISALTSIRVTKPL